jgi:methionine aminotransferase
MKIDSKLPNFGTTIFTLMSQLATEHKALNLGQGFPDFNPDERLTDLVTAAIKNGHNQYPPMAGIPALRLAISTKVKNLYGHHYDPDTEVTVTSGASEGLMSSIMAFVKAGDEVVVIEPFYDLYLPVIELAGGTPVIVSMEAPTASNPFYRVDWDRVSAAITAKTRMLIINFPHNPTGINITATDLDELERIVEETGILILSDEVYEHIIFDDQPHQSMARRERLAQNSIVVSSFGKTYHTTGWKVGYCCAPKVLSAEIRKVHQFGVFTVSSPMQVALAEHMKDTSPYRQLPSFYQKKYQRLSDGLSTSRFRPLASEGTFFLLADYSSISDLPESEFARWLTTEHGVGVIPVSAFYRQPNAPEANHRLVRFCFAKQDQTLDDAVHRLQTL